MGGVFLLRTEISGRNREEIGSNASHRIRDRGHVPAVLYGYHKASNALCVDARELEYTVKNYGTNAMLDLHLENRDATVMIKEIQRNPVTKEIIHVDFQEVSLYEPVHTMIPIKLVGKGRAEYREGVIQQQLREIHVECLPKFIPESIEVDVAKLMAGYPLRVADVEFSRELSVLNDPQEIIVVLTKAEKTAEITEGNSDLAEKAMSVPKQ
ncbi:MAG TPA: 50S ribosomal protein L25 [Bacteroidales bacterium]|nr:50S ribosomal protein L25 [Bacteroidales bacterium]